MQNRNNEPAEPLLVPFERVSSFIRQVTHDVRNNLNAMDLQSAFVVELVSDPEAVDEVRRIRSHIQTAAKQLQALSANFWSAQPNPVTYSASIFVEDLQDRLAKMYPDDAPALKWSVDLGDEMISVDLEMIFNAFAELFENTFDFKGPAGPPTVRTWAEDGNLRLEITEEKPAPATELAEWGQQPFVSTKRGGYGLGVFRSRRILDVHGGELAYSYDTGRGLLLTSVTLPLAPSA